MRPITLGTLIDQLQYQPQDNQVRFDFGCLYPNGYDSYRGYYQDLAISYGGLQKTVSSFLKELNDCIGDTFSGWKGDEFTMWRDSLLWVAVYGKSSHTAIMGLADSESYITVIETKYISSQNLDRDD